MIQPHNSYLSVLLYSSYARRGVVFEICVKCQAVLIPITRHEIAMLSLELRRSETDSISSPSFSPLPQRNLVKSVHLRLTDSISAVFAPNIDKFRLTIQTEIV